MSFLHDTRQHGGPDAGGAAPHDFSTNGNACGPCPDVLRALQRTDAEHYPDPTYTAVRQRLADVHGVDAARIVIAASASEFIVRITAAVAVHGGAGAQVLLPTLFYGDYARAAQAWRLPVRRVDTSIAAATEAAAAPAGVTTLIWHCEPSSPLGRSDARLGDALAALPGAAVCVVDLAYAPLRLEGRMPAGTNALDRAWQLWTPNKALGLTGIRAAYAIAPVDAGLWRDAVTALAPSWPVGSHGVALLDAWTREPVRAWLADSLVTLRGWKAQQLALCESMGWRCLPGDANFFCAAPPVDDVAALCAGLRAQGVKLRDTTSFGLPGHVRMVVSGPAAQAAVAAAYRR